LIAGETRVFGHHLGPGRASRAMAIVHIAVFDAINAIVGGHQSYTGIAAAPRDASVKAAIGQAARDTLVALYPSMASAFDDKLTAFMEAVEDGPSEEAGLDAGRRAAAAILELRADDGSDHLEPLVGEGYVPEDGPGFWRQDPISELPVALGAHWSVVRPFVLESASQFRLPPPPALGSAEYAAAFEEVKRLGGDGVTTPTERTDDQTLIGIYWAYDGTPSLCAPPRLYNQIAVQIAAEQGTDVVGLWRW
jgi:hypothetical protein